MLIIRRRPGQSILIGDGVEVQILEAGSSRVKLGISAPASVSILRKETAETRAQNLTAALGATPSAVSELLGKFRT
jgi:carbon storage regulator